MYYMPNLKEDAQGRQFLGKCVNGKRIYKYKLRVQYLDEVGNISTQPNAKYAKIKSINEIPYNNPDKIFSSRSELKEAVYMFIYNLYNLANHLADIENNYVGF